MTIEDHNKASLQSEARTYRIASLSVLFVLLCTLTVMALFFLLPSVFAKKWLALLDKHAFDATTIFLTLFVFVNVYSFINDYLSQKTPLRVFGVNLQFRALDVRYGSDPTVGLSSDDPMPLKVRLRFVYPLMIIAPFLALVFYILNNN